jgi:hypothetical protein
VFTTHKLKSVIRTVRVPIMTRFDSCYFALVPQTRLKDCNALQYLMLQQNELGQMHVMGRSSDFSRGLFDTKSRLFHLVSDDRMPHYTRRSCFA